MQHQVLLVTNNFYSFGNTNRSIVESILPGGRHLLYFCHIARECIYGAVACKKHCAIWYPITPNPLLTSTVASVAILMELSSPNYLGTHQVVLPFWRNFPHPRFLSPYLPQHLLTFNIFRARQFSLAAATLKNDKWQLMHPLHLLQRYLILNKDNDRAALKIDIRS